MRNKTPLLVIVGPTASGKTSLSVKLALKYNGEIVSADSMQIYKGMDIGTAKITTSEMHGVSHHLIDIVNPSENFSVAKYVKLAKKAISDIHNRGRLPVVVGGTGLYINSLLQNINFGNFNGDSEYRKYLNEIAKEKGGAELKKMLSEVDMESALHLHENDIKRLIRALEIYKVTGRTKTEWVRESKAIPSPYNSLIIGLTFENRQVLYDRINERVRRMIEFGLVDEVKNLLNSGIDKNTTAMQGIGYKEIVGFIEGERTLEEATECIKQESRRYAKRQLTWFRKNERIKWIFVDKENKDLNILNTAKKYVENYSNL